MVEKILNNTTPYGKIWASHEGSLHSSTLSKTEHRKGAAGHRQGAGRVPNDALHQTGPG